MNHSRFYALSQRLALELRLSTQQAADLELLLNGAFKLLKLFRLVK